MLAHEWPAMSQHPEARTIGATVTLCIRVNSGLIRAWFRLDRGFHIGAEQEAPRSQELVRIRREDERPVYPITVDIPRPQAARRISVLARRQHRR